MSACLSDLEYQVLQAFRCALAGSEFDAAEHLLRALETLDQIPGGDTLRDACRRSLLEKTELLPHQRRSALPSSA